MPMSTANSAFNRCDQNLNPTAALRAIKLIHTLVLAFFAGCIFAIPVFAWHGRFDSVLLAADLIAVETVILIVNGWRCPLTGVTARYTDARRDIFDIYLPLWLARHNKLIFGWLFTAGLLLARAVAAAA
jgi:hypothetical protein